MGIEGNKKVQNFEELTQMEKMSLSGAGKIVEVSREKFEKTMEDYKKIRFLPFALK
ncbi:hypothetical protein LDL59_00080 [Kaistella anthropi]|nr:hypothetical protein [Kaistella anthropi]